MVNMNFKVLFEEGLVKNYLVYRGDSGNEACET